MTLGPRIGAALAVATVCLVSACSDAVPGDTPGGTGRVVKASGPVTATFDFTQVPACTLHGNTLTLVVAAADDASTRLVVTLRDFHGAGVYTNWLGRAADTGDTIEVDHGTAIWVAAAGSVTVESYAYANVGGVLDITTRPDASADGIVALGGDWGCNAHNT